MCCSLVRWNWPVKSPMLHIHKLCTDSVTPIPCVSPPWLFNDLISYCSIIKSVHNPPQNLSLLWMVWYPFIIKFSYTHGNLSGKSSIVANAIEHFWHNITNIRSFSKKIIATRGKFQFPVLSVSLIQNEILTQVIKITQYIQINI